MSFCSDGICLVSPRRSESSRFRCAFFDNAGMEAGYPKFEVSIAERRLEEKDVVIDFGLKFGDHASSDRLGE